MNQIQTAEAVSECLLASQFGLLEDAYYQQNRWLTDIYALNLLQPLLKAGYLPYTLTALRPGCLAFVLNDIIINDRKAILEFGAGISTILMGRLIKANGLQARIVSVEHNQKWAEMLKGILHREELEDSISVIYAPLTHCPYALDSNEWYDTTILEPALMDKLFDMVLVDGPPAYERHKMKSRYPALLFANERRAERSIVFLDDAEREGEKAVLARWSEEFSLLFHITGGGLAYSNRGDNFNAHIG